MSGRCDHRRISGGQGRFGLFDHLWFTDVPVNTRRDLDLDIEYFTQKFDGVDSKIRNITTNVYWIRKQPIRRWISKAILVPYGIVFPDKNSNNVGEIVNGYYQPGFWARVRAEKCNRRKYYKYFDSWATRELPALPSDRKIIYPWSWGGKVKNKGFSLDNVPD